MGIVRVTLGVTNPDTDAMVSIEDAIADTGSIHTCIPRRVAAQLGLRVTGQRGVVTASGPEVFDESFAFLDLQGKSIMSPILISDSLDDTIVGVTLLEWLGFLVDPVRKELRETEILFL